MTSGDSASAGDGRTAGGEGSDRAFSVGVGGTAGDPAAGRAAGEIPPGAVIAERYEVLARLGEGGMGTVYRVRDRLRGGVEVALKTLQSALLERPKAVERFYREVEVSLRLSHDNIVRVHDIGEDRARGLRFYTMELVPGRTLRDLIEERRREKRAIEPREALRIVEQILEALRYAHRTTVHRDLKPENVMLTSDGAVKVLDFGIAKLRDLPHLTADRAAIGTAYYMAPEQRADAGKADGRADIYAASVILYELLTGELPLGRFRTPSEEGSPVPRELDEVVLRGLETAPERRFGTADEVLGKLRAIRAAIERGAAAPARSRSPVVALLAALLIPLAIGAVALALLGELPTFVPDPTPKLEPAPFELKIWDPREQDIVVDGDSASVRGVSTRRAGVTINGKATETLPGTDDLGRSTTSFEALLPLALGHNVIAVEARDLDGAAPPQRVELDFIRVVRLTEKEIVVAGEGPSRDAAENEAKTVAAGVLRVEYGLDEATAAMHAFKGEVVEAKSLPDGRVHLEWRVATPPAGGR